jgi:hypothetical protein
MNARVILMIYRKHVGCGLTKKSKIGNIQADNCYLKTPAGLHRIDFMNDRSLYNSLAPYQYFL